jgi:hypothetical protein
LINSFALQWKNNVCHYNVEFSPETFLAITAWIPVPPFQVSTGKVSKFQLKKIPWNFTMNT